MNDSTRLGETIDDMNEPRIIPVGSKMSKADYYKFLALRGRLAREHIPETLAESQFLAELERKGYDFMDYFGAHHLFAENHLDSGQTPEPYKSD